MSYLPSGSIQLVGDISGIGTGNSSVNTTLATVNSNVGTFGSSTTIPILTVNAKGLVTAVSTATVTSSGTFAGSVSVGGSLSVSGSTSLSGSATAPTPATTNNSTNIATTAFVNSFVDSITGDATLSGTTLTLASVGTAGTYGAVNLVTILTVDAKGRVTHVTTSPISITSANITGTIPITQGGTGSTTAAAALTALGGVANAGNAPSVQTGTAASLPTAGTAGRLYVATDTLALYLDSGSAWSTVSTASSSTFYFYAYCTSTITLGSSPTPITLNTEVRKDTTYFSHTTGASSVTILVAGWYFISAQACFNATTGSCKGVMNLYQNGSNITGAQATFGQTNSAYATEAVIECLVQCNANDVINWQASYTAGGFSVIANNTRLLIKTA